MKHARIRRGDESGTLGIENVKRALDGWTDARYQHGDTVLLFRETEGQASPYGVIDEVSARRSHFTNAPHYLWKMCVSCPYSDS